MIIASANRTYFSNYYMYALQGKTTVKKNSYNPIWNEELIFTEMFPPLCQRIKVRFHDVLFKNHVMRILQSKRNNVRACNYVCCFIDFNLQIGSIERCRSS